MERHAHFLKALAWVAHISSAQLPLAMPTCTRARETHSNHVPSYSSLFTEGQTDFVLYLVIFAIISSYSKLPMSILPPLYIPCKKSSN